jgi:hypothetical protein
MKVTSAEAMDVEIPAVDKSQYVDPAGNRVSDMVFGEIVNRRGGLTASKLRVTRGLPRGPSRLPAGQSPSMQQLPPSSIPPPAGCGCVGRRWATGGTYTYTRETSLARSCRTWLAAHKGVNPIGDDPAGNGTFPAGSFWSDLLVRGIVG